LPPPGAAAFAKAGGKKPWDEIETELLNGQKLQGTITAADIMTALKGRGCEDEFPMFVTIYNIAFTGAPLSDITTKVLPPLGQPTLFKAML